jgi:hypothetical protein
VPVPLFVTSLPFASFSLDPAGASTVALPAQEKKLVKLISWGQKKVKIKRLKNSILSNLKYLNQINDITRRTQDNF